ncbi:uncharacterized protein LOC121778087 isoform X2 [Salvia splendens]|uniref:uncharacterized protein LOC121778087 isoform X2 n=1 Tax=Salvia splendens TaxID=180675 RepID=UPI001C2643AB|nr:uncharacterized protein LOC121778087 isoform X2 [Salvia splendens]
MIRSPPTVASYLPHLQTQTSATAAVSTSHTISHAYGSSALSSGSGATRRPVLRRSTPTITVELDSAATTVRKFYDGINRRDLSSVEDLIALNCVYEDLIFSQPFTGRKFSDSISGDLQFAIDDISDQDTSAVGATWHLEWKGKPFPFSRGCSFYRLDVINGQRQIVFGRDAVEPAIKPGETALVVIRGVTWLLQSFPFLGDRL